MSVEVLVALISILLSGISIKVATASRRDNREQEHALKQARLKAENLQETLVEVLDEHGSVRGQLALPGRPADRDVTRRIAIAEESVSTIEERLKAQQKALREEADKIEERLKAQQKALREETDKIVAELKATKAALDTSKANEAALAKTLAEVVDQEGTVLAQIRLPGEKVRPPNRTPCGDMCKKAVLSEEVVFQNGYSHKEKAWRCRAGQGKKCDDVRKQFEDVNGQCVLWEEDDD